MNMFRVAQGIVILLLTPLLLSTGFLLVFEATAPSMARNMPAGPYPGDAVIPDAVMVYDQTRLVHAPPEVVWPWILQVGKGRAGWYAPTWFEKILPQGWHASRTINPEWQSLKPGDRVDDYGFSPDDYFIVTDIDPEKALVYKSDRYGAHFSWSLILHQVAEGEKTNTLVHLRFRGKIAATGLKRRLIVWGGGVMDHLTTAPMLAGLAERAEAGWDNDAKKDR